MVLDVDGHVLNADDLLERVNRLIQRIDENGPQTGDKSSGPAASSRSRGLGDPIPPMSALHDPLHPPALEAPTGAKNAAPSLMKRMVQRLAGWYVEPRWAAQQNYDGHNIHFAIGVVEAFQRIDSELEQLQRHNVQLKLQVVASVERLNRYRREVDSFLQGVASRSDVEKLGHEVERLGAAGASGVEIDYRAFEDRCRGDSSDIRKGQESYLKYFPGPSGTGKVLDIGCGRGEMVELLLEAGYDAVGVDLNREMVDLCTKKGLPVLLGDGISYLEQMPDDSMRGIFCAQVVEHLLTSEIERLVELSYQKLMRGGVLILETINPRSLHALGNHFFADTSHTRPVHPETLRFICEQVGFTQVALEERSVHPAMNLVQTMPDGETSEAVEELVRSVFGFQDYAIIANR
jgi:2-polyprenyl-3-methyl-5-hydroxy-6-metoxy-1,4-benzoquinol methylase